MSQTVPFTFRSSLWLFLFLVISNYGCAEFHSGGSLSAENSRLSTEAENVGSLCELIDSTVLSEEKEIQIRTTMLRIGGVTTIGDEKCKMRHPVVDVEIDPQFPTAKCESGDAKELCLLIEDHRRGKSSSAFEIEATFIGRFQSFEMGKGFTVNGKRFRFYLQDVGEVHTIRRLDVDTAH